MEIHVVQHGNTLWSIAHNYQSSINQIALVNGLDHPDTLVVGQALVIPEPSKEYIVQPGDTLWGIAKRYGVPVQQLAANNNLSNPQLLFVGELIKLPYWYYTIQAGDSLWAIANKNSVSIDEMVQLNNIAEPGLIYIGQSLKIPAAFLPTAEVNAYTTNINKQGTQEVLYLGRNFTYLSPFMYAVRSNGTITSMDEEALLEAARQNNVAPLMVLTTFSGGTFDSDLAAAILRNPELQEKLITTVLAEMEAKQYTGLNIDFEYVYPEDRQNYNDFLRRVVGRLHPKGYSVSTALAPKISGSQSGLLYEAHDYQAHGEIVDFVVLMTYEWGWAGGEPWAIAPINKVKEVLDYAVTVIPRKKILMGVPLYGRDWKIPWVKGTYARTVSPKEAVQLAAKYGVAIQYDEKYQSPYFRYRDENGQQHEVWFEDARSVQAKYDTIKAYGLRGASYWVLGSSFPQNWPVLQTNFSIKKV